MTNIQLEPLSLEQVEQLVADSLPGAAREVVAPLAALVHEKTGGNPFFLLQLMVMLHQDGLLARTPGGGWRWDAEGVRARSYSDNVVDFMVGRLRQLPAETQHLLRLAACVGNVFSLQMLGTLSERAEVGGVEQRLEPALQEGLLVRAGPEQYRFLHDRIQQAAHGLLSEEERKAVHLRIGRLLLRSLSREDASETIFDVVNQLNAGMDLIDKPEERHHLARLNAEAGWKAEAAVAHRPAITYLTTAFALIPADPWQTDPELAFRVRLSRATCELWSGNIAEARSLAEELRSRARTRADIAAASGVKSEICLAAGEAQKAVTCMLECLAQLGMPLSPHPTWEEVLAAHQEVEALLEGRAIESLIHLPPMTDPDMKVVMGALYSIHQAAYVTEKHLFLIVMCRMVSLSLRHGFAEAAVIGFSWLGMTTSTGTTGASLASTFPGISIPS
jgi:predicted ATPase